LFSDNIFEGQVQPEERDIMIETPTFAIHSKDLRNMCNEDIVKEALDQRRKIQRLERKVEGLRRDLLKQRAISRRLVGTLGEVYLSERSQRDDRTFLSTTTCLRRSPMD
jgi:hypothetical protein